MICVKSAGSGDLHEFSWGRYDAAADGVVIELSTHTQRVGERIDLDQRWIVETYRSL